MDESIKQALERDRTIDITTTGRKTGQPRRTEIWFHNVEGRLYITGTPGRRDWYANLLAHPEFTFHLKQSVAPTCPPGRLPSWIRRNAARSWPPFIKSSGQARFRGLGRGQSTSRRGTPDRVISQRLSAGGCGRSMGSCLKKRHKSDVVGSRLMTPEFHTCMLGSRSN